MSRAFVALAAGIVLGLTLAYAAGQLAHSLVVVVQ